MNSKYLIFLFLSVALTTGCSTGGSAVNDEAQYVDVKVVDGPVDTSADANADPDEVICTRRHKVGSNFARMECKTRREIEQDRRAAQQELETNRVRSQGRALQHANSGG